jgi:hypothetical protein
MRKKYKIDSQANHVFIELKRGYFAVKDNYKFWIDEKIYDYLPVRVLLNECEDLIYDEDVVKRPLKPIPFKILPGHSMLFRKMVDEFVPLEHTNPLHWKLMKLIAISSFVGRLYVCIATEPEFGKSSIFDVIDFLTDRCPVFKPRSVPGVLNHINGTGNIVFDEVTDCKKEVREIMEEFSLQIGGGKTVYLNGAMKTPKTREKYNCILQSITYLYNTFECYSSKEGFFDYMFSNNKAMDTRFLKIRMNGKLTERFDREFNLEEIAKQNRDVYIAFAKELLYLQQLKSSNGYERKFVTNSCIYLKGRKKNVYNEVTWCIDMYCTTQEEYDIFINELDNCIMGYKEMIFTQKKHIVEEEVKDE